MFSSSRIQRVIKPGAAHAYLSRNHCSPAAAVFTVAVLLTVPLSLSGCSTDSADRADSLSGGPSATDAASSGTPQRSEVGALPHPSLADETDSQHPSAASRPKPTLSNDAGVSSGSASDDATDNGSGRAGDSSAAGTSSADSFQRFLKPSNGTIPSYYFTNPSRTAVCTWLQGQSGQTTDITCDLAQWQVPYDSATSCHYYDRVSGPDFSNRVLLPAGENACITIVQGWQTWWASPSITSLDVVPILPPGETITTHSGVTCRTTQTEIECTRGKTGFRIGSGDVEFLP